MLKRVLLVSATQCGVLVTFFLLLFVTGGIRELLQHGIPLHWLIVGGIVWGWMITLFTLIFIQPVMWSLLHIRTILPRFAKNQEKWVCDIVAYHARQSDLKKIPTVGIFRSPEIKIFSLGLSRQQACIAISTGALAQISPTQLEAKIAHEISHIANGDNVTLILMQGMLNAFGLFLSLMAFYAVYLAFWLCHLTKEEKQRYSMLSYTLLRKAFHAVFFIPGGLIVKAFSRYCEMQLP